MAQPWAGVPAAVLSIIEDANADDGQLFHYPLPSLSTKAKGVLLLSQRPASHPSASDDWARIAHIKDIPSDWFSSDPICEGHYRLVVNSGTHTVCEEWDVTRPIGPLTWSGPEIIKPRYVSPSGTSSEGQLGLHLGDLKFVLSDTVPVDAVVEVQLERLGLRTASEPFNLSIPLQAQVAGE